MNKNNHPLYWSWAQMVARCRRSTHKDWKYYGGRGIKVCERWLRFDNFLADMGERPTGMELDRVDNNGSYCKENCRWATRKQQMNNINPAHPENVSKGRTGLRLSDEVKAARKARMIERGTYWRKT